MYLYNDLKVKFGGEMRRLHDAVTSQLQQLGRTLDFII